MPHTLEAKYGLTANDLLDTVAARFRLRVALEGGVAEMHMAKQIARLVGSTVERFIAHDQDGHPDFSIWLPGRAAPLFAECKNIRDSSKPGGAEYRHKGKIVAYKVETQKTRASTGDPTSRYYDIGYYHVLGVCMGKKTNKWADFLFARSVDLVCHAKYSNKLAVFQRVPLWDAGDLSPWYADLGELLRNFDAPPCR